MSELNESANLRAELSAASDVQIRERLVYVFFFGGFFWGFFLTRTGHSLGIDVNRRMLVLAQATVSAMLRHQSVITTSNGHST